LPSLQHRIVFIDGLRGLAILGVLVFHAYVCSPENLPFGDQFGVVPLRLGWVGVELFFLISGFVILMTLENCRDTLDFAVRRWLRLFPAMLIASVLILAFDFYLGIGPLSKRTIIDAIPGFLFISPSLIHALTGVNLESLDAPFWTLYVEVAFYSIFAAAYFAAGRKAGITLIFGLAVASYSANLIAAFGQGGIYFDKIAKAMDWLGFTQFFWFASGALFYRYFVTKKSTLLSFAIFMAVIAALTDGIFRFSLVDRAGLLFAVALFACSVHFEQVQGVISNRIFLFFGFISYPLYLIHNNMLIGMEGEIAKRLPTFLKAGSPILPIVLLSFVSWLIAKYAEPAMRRMLRSKPALTPPSPAT
jgi:peptidoglycan/LPS O-acetylase OafA/YrhL